MQSDGLMGKTSSDWALSGEVSSGRTVGKLSGDLPSGKQVIGRDTAR